MNLIVFSGICILVCTWIVFTEHFVSNFLDAQWETFLEMLTGLYFVINATLNLILHRSIETFVVHFHFIDLWFSSCFCVTKLYVL